MEKFYQLIMGYSKLVKLISFCITLTYTKLQNMLPLFATIKHLWCE